MSGCGLDTGRGWEPARFRVELAHAADVKLHDALVVEQLLGRTVQPVAPEHEDVAPVRVAESAPGVLLHYADPDAGSGDLLYLLPERALEQGGQTGTRLVEQQHCWLEHERPGHGEHAALTPAEQPRPAAERPAEVGEQL